MKLTVSPVKLDSGLYWVDPNAPVEENFPQVVMEKLVNGMYHLWALDNVNDIDRSCQSVIIAQSVKNYELINCIPCLLYETKLQQITQELTRRTAFGRRNERLGSIFCEAGIERGIEQALRVLASETYGAGNPVRDEYLSRCMASIKKIDEPYTELNLTLLPEGGYETYEEDGVTYLLTN